MIKAVMNYTLDDMSAFCRYVKSTKDIIGFYAALFIIYAAGIIGFAIYGIETWALLIMCAVLLVIGGMFLYLYLTVIKNGPDREFEKIKEKYKEQPLYFEFEFSRFAVSPDLNDNLQKIVVDYLDVKQVVETEEYFFIICPEKDDDFILRKSAIIEGSLKDLNDIFKSQLRGKIVKK